MRLSSSLIIISSFSLIFSFSLNASAQAPKGNQTAKSKDEIPWKASRKLVWADFKGKPAAQESKYALTTSDISVGVSCDGSNFSYQVNAVFVPSESWTKSTDSDALLAHEQLHFDITELHSRKMKLMFSMLPKPCLLKQPEIQSLIDKSFKDWHKMEIAYDEETNHGLNKDKQLAWQKMISLSLEELSDL